MTARSLCAAVPEPSSGPVSVHQDQCPGACKRLILLSEDFISLINKNSWLPKQSDSRLQHGPWWQPLTAIILQTGQLRGRSVLRSQLLLTRRTPCLVCGLSKKVTVKIPMYQNSSIWSIMLRFKTKKFEGRDEKCSPI